MNREDYQKVKEVFQSALDRAPEERSSFLDEACKNDANLRREVEKLLSSFEISFLEKPAIGEVAELIVYERGSIKIGQKFSHYEIAKKLGAGGMGEVFLAKDTKLERLVSLKILSGDFSNNEDRIRRFSQEAKAVSALNHPNILTIYEIGQFEELRFIATEYINGETLREREQRKPLTLREILEITLQICAALDAAHKEKIIHRDIKPENIMIREDSLVKVLDFGLAKLSRDSDISQENLTLTTPGMVMGTSLYMSPEQIRGMAEVDNRTDIWSLGVVLFEMLTNQVPFPGLTVNDVIASVLKTALPRLSAINPNCPAELERIVTKLLQKDREERYQEIKYLAFDLEQLKKGLEFSNQSDLISTPFAPRQTGGILKRLTFIDFVKPFSLSFALPTLLLVGLLSASFWWFFVKSSIKLESISTNPLKIVEVVNWSSSPGEGESVGKFSPDGKITAYASTEGGAKNIWIKQTNSGNAVQITKDEFKNQSPVWSPNGDEIAFVSQRGNQNGIWRIPYLGGSPKLVKPIEDGISLKFWSKEDLLFYEYRRNIYSLDVNSKQSKQLTNLDPNQTSTINIAQNGEQIIYVSNTNNIWTIWSMSLENQSSPNLIFQNAAEIRNVIWHPDNQRVLYSSLVDGTFQIFVIDSNGGTPKQVTFAEKDCFGVDISADGSNILFGSAKEESDIWRVNLADSKETTVVSDINSELWATVSPDGKTIAYQSIKNLSQGNNLFTGEILTKSLGSNERSVKLVNSGSLPIWSPNGQQIAFMSWSNQKRELNTIGAFGGEIRTLPAKEIDLVDFLVLPYLHTQSHEFSWSHNSQKIAYVSDDGTRTNIRAINADGTNDLQITNNLDENLFVSCPIWSSDSKQIAYTVTPKHSSANKPSSLQIVNLETNEFKLIFSSESLRRLIGWSQDEENLIFESSKNPNALPPEIDVSQVSVSTGISRKLITLKNAYLHNIFLSPDRKTLAFVERIDGQDNIRISPASGGESKKLTTDNDPRIYVSSLSWSPDSGSIFFGKQSRYSLLSIITNFK